MSNRIDELLEQYCPDGVDYMKLGEIATISRGGSFQKKDFREEGIPCIHYGQIYTKYGLFVDETITFIDPAIAQKQKHAVKNDIVMAVTSENIEDVCKCVAYFGDEPVAVSGHTAIIHHNQNAKFLVYYLNSSMFFAQKVKLAHGTKVIEVTPDTLSGVEVPVPPLEVQREIVRVLDNFTLLRAELSAELSARRKQYEHYRNELLTFGDDVPKVKFIDIIKGISSGKNKTKSIEGTFPVYGSTGEIGRTEEAVYSGKRILVARVGANAGFVYVVDGEYDVSDNTLMIEVKDEMNFRYVYQMLVNMNLNKLAKGGGQPLVTSGDLKKMDVYNPAYEMQERISFILDKFNLLCNDISSGIPAEIEARTKQYEFYRDKLLSFKRKEAS